LTLPDANDAVMAGRFDKTGTATLRTMMADKRSFRGLLWTLAILGLTIDLGSKYGVFRWLGKDIHGEYVVVPGAFRLIAQFTTEPLETGTWRETLQMWNGSAMPRVNHGALFGLGNTGTTTSNGLFMVISVVAAVIITIWSIRGTSTRDGFLCAALGLILGGTLGNLFDRVVFHGVRDFLYFHWFEWPVFNVADCCLVCGAGLLLIQSLWPSRVKQPAEVQARELAQAG
jgi:lipoprotein signal peptidase